MLEKQGKRETFREHVTWLALGFDLEDLDALLSNCLPVMVILDIEVLGPRAYFGYLHDLDGTTVVFVQFCVDMGCIGEHRESTRLEFVQEVHHVDDMAQ